MDIIDVFEPENIFCFIIYIFSPTSTVWIQVDGYGLDLDNSHLVNSAKQKKVIRIAFSRKNETKMGHQLQTRF